MLAGFLPRLASLVSQPAVLAAGVATGVAVGAVGVGTGTIPVTDPGPRLVALFECPDSSRVVTNLPPNQSVLVTARSADGAWLQIYVGEATAERGWARATSLQLKAAPDTLPVADCTPTATAEPTLAPPSGLTSPAASAAASLAPSGALPSALPSAAPLTGAPVTPSPTPSPSKTPKPTKTPTPTATPLTGPVISHIQVHTGEVDFDGVYRLRFGCAYQDYAGFTVDAADSDGTEQVTLYYRWTGGTTQSHPMYEEDSFGELWDDSLAVQANWVEGPLEVWFRGVDSLGNLGPIFYPSSEGVDFAVGVCKP